MNIKTPERMRLAPFIFSILPDIANDLLFVRHAGFAHRTTHILAQVRSRNWTKGFEFQASMNPISFKLPIFQRESASSSRRTASPAR